MPFGLFKASHQPCLTRRRTFLYPQLVDQHSVMLCFLGRGRSWSGGANSGTPDSARMGPQQKFALQCYASEDKQQDVASSQQWALLSQFEYVLRLCMLESREETPHHLIGVNVLSLLLIIVTIVMIVMIMMIITVDKAPTLHP